MRGEREASVGGLCQRKVISYINKTSSLLLLLVLHHVSCKCAHRELPRHMNSSHYKEKLKQNTQTHTKCTIKAVKGFAILVAI